MAGLIVIWLVALNIGTFAAFGMDKMRARAAARRIAETRLLLLALAGGTPGAYAGRAWFRHKTRKQPFSGRLHLIAVIQCGALLGIGGAGLAA